MRSDAIPARFGTPGRYRWAVFGVLSIIYFMACLHRVAPTVIAGDLVLEFDTDATALGVMASAYFYLYAAVQPPVGVLSDTLGPRAVTTAFACIACAGVMLFALAPGMAWATAGRALVGIGVGGVFIPALKIFSRWFRKKEFASITGLFLAFGNAGNLSASLPLTYLVILLGWRASFMALGIVTLVMVFLAWLVVRDRPEDKGWPPVEADDAAAEAFPASPNRFRDNSSDVSPSTSPSTSPDTAGEAPAGTGTFARLSMVAGNTDFWKVTFSYFFFGGPALAFQGLWAVPYLVDVHGYGRMAAGGLLMLIPLGFIIGAPLVGVFSDRLSAGRKPVILLTLGTALACWSVFLLTGARPPGALIGPLFLVIGLCGGGTLSLYFSMIRDLFPPWLTGTAIGLMNPAAFLGTALFQPFSGYLMDLVGRIGTAYPREAYHHMFIAVFISMTIGILAIAMVRNRR